MLRYFHIAVLIGGLCLAACSSPSAPRPQPRTAPSVKVALEGFSKWQRVCESERARPTFSGNAANVSDPARARAWSSLYDRLRNAPEMEKIRETNRFFNGFPYREDKDAWGMEDHWATPGEFMENGGDCEDFAIVKYFALREMGFAADSLRIAGVWNKAQGRGHAVLTVRSGGESWMLDNLEENPLPQESVSHYVPQYFVNENAIWRRP